MEGGPLRSRPSHFVITWLATIEPNCIARGNREAAWTCPTAWRFRQLHLVTKRMRVPSNRYKHRAQVQRTDGPIRQRRVRITITPFAPVPYGSESSSSSPRALDPTAVRNRVRLRVGEWPTSGSGVLLQCRMGRNCSPPAGAVRVAPCRQSRQRPR
jgi:hypothetical protein